MGEYVPEIECPDCDGWGFLKAGPIPAGPMCFCCRGKGWRPMTDDEQEAAWQRQQEDAMSEPPETLAEQHRRAWEQHQELHRR